MKITLNGEPVSYDKETEKWRCSNPAGKAVLDLQTQITLNKIPPMAYTGASEIPIFEDIRKGLEGMGFDFRYEEVSQADHAARDRMIETEEGKQQMFGSAEGFVSYFYSIQK